MKKMLKVFGIIAIVTCLIVLVVACDNNNSGKNSIDVVAVSESEYASVEDTLKGYVSEELAYSVIRGDQEYSVINAKYVSKDSKGNVASKNIKLSDTQKTNLASAEKFEVKVQVGSLDKDSEEVFTDSTQIVYVLKYGDKYRYMVSMPETGERLTNSCLKMFTDTSKYENCTVSEIYKEKGYEDEDLVFFEAIEYKFTAEAIYKATYYDKTRYDNRTPGVDENTGDRISYSVANGDRVAIVNNKYNEFDEEEWTAIDLSSGIYGNTYKNMEFKDYNKYMFEFTIFGIFADLPAAAFTKTANGFGLKEKAGEWTIEYKFTVSDNKIVGINYSQEVSWTDEEVKKDEQDTSITNFGSTTVSVPAEVTAALSELEA